MNRFRAFILAAALVMLAAFGLTACSSGASGDKTLNILNWGDYIDETILDDFEKETGITVNYYTMPTNEEMLVQLQTEGNVYDMCFPSDYIIERMIAKDMLAELDHDKIPNMSNIDSRFLNIDFDPGNKYSIPYMWGTVGILYNTTMVDETVESWNILWDEKYDNKILMYDSIRDTIGLTLKKLGYSMNTRDEAQIAEARDALITQKGLVLAYCGDDIKEKMISGSAALGVVYSGDAYYCMSENPDLAYAVPKEGSNYWFDNVVVLKTCKNLEAAEKFIDFLCRADIAARNAEYIGYSTPNKAALEQLPEEMIADETYNPPQDVLDRCEMFHDLGDFINVYNDAWIQVKSK